MKMNRGLKLCSIFLLVFALALAGCSGVPSNQATGGKANDGKKITLEFWTVPTLDQADYEKAIKKYTTDIAPNVEIKLSYVPFTGIDEKVNVAIAANTFPDLYMDGSVRLGPLYSRGIAAPLDSFVTPDYNMGDFLDGPMQLGKLNGKLHSFVVAANVGTLMINRALFKQANAEDLLPDSNTRGWTRDKFAKAVEKIGALGNGIYGMGLPAVDFSQDRYVDSYIFSDGDGFTNDAYDKITYNSDKNIKNFDWLVNLTNTKEALPGSAGNRDTSILELFKQGKVGVMTYNFGFFDVIKSGLKDGSIKAPMEVMFGHFPTDDGGVPKIWLSIYGIVVKKQDDAERMKEAAKFAMWFTSGKDDELNQAIYVKKGHTPVRKSLQGLVTEPELKKLASMQEKPIGNIFSNPNYFQFRKMWANQYQPALNKNINAKQALDNYAKEAQKLLDEQKAVKK